ncbi:MAG TPA: LytTR family DNA-binding domain-containing protein [Opitutaceae bacterium]
MQDSEFSASPFSLRHARSKAADRFLVKARHSYVIVHAHEIQWAESAANYVVLHTARGKHVLRCTLAELDRRLTEQSFFRASRSALVNLDCIREIQLPKTGKRALLLTDGTRVPLARALNQLREKL